MAFLFLALVSISLAAGGVMLARLGFERLSQLCLVCSFIIVMVVSATIGTESAI